MTYPIIERTHFSDKETAWRFAQSISRLNHHIVIDFGVDDNKEPYFVETINDPFSTKDELLRKAGLI